MHIITSIVSVQALPKAMLKRQNPHHF